MPLKPIWQVMAGWPMVTVDPAGFSSVILVMLMGQSRIFFIPWATTDLILKHLANSASKNLKHHIKANYNLFVFVGFCGICPRACCWWFNFIGTLFAFVLVCAGVLLLRVKGTGYCTSIQNPVYLVVPITGVWSFVQLMIVGDGCTTLLKVAFWMVLGLGIILFYRHNKEQQSLLI